MKYNDQVILAAHRGDRKCFPENTLPAFESAMRLGVDMIETDIHMTLDGHLVIMHDRNAKRTTGFDGLTDQMNLCELEALDASAGFEGLSNVKIPRVEEFIDLIKNSDMLVNWELKDYPNLVGEEFAFKAVDKLVDLIEKHGLEERSMLNSFSDRVLEHAYLKYGHTFTLHGQGIYHCPQSVDTAQTSLDELYDWCCLYTNEAGKAPIDFPENFEYCVQRGIFPCVCVPDRLDAYKRYVELGCRMFTSNDIYEADKILRSLGLR